ncbi:MAG: hypothetical protein GY702_14260 [Desulfobulbaceae bacterium]|nr:hypothetical protein [Desulfobulbaceae bacterium]
MKKRYFDDRILNISPLNIFVFLLFLLFLCTACGSTPPPLTARVTSNPSGAKIFGGKDRYSLKLYESVTPWQVTKNTEHWNPWCFKIIKEGYADSEIKCSGRKYGDKHEHFNLVPGQASRITLNPEYERIEEQLQEARYELRQFKNQRNSSAVASGIGVLSNPSSYNSSANMARGFELDRQQREIERKVERLERKLNYTKQYLEN